MASTSILYNLQYCHGNTRDAALAALPALHGVFLTRHTVRDDRYLDRRTSGVPPKRPDHQDGTTRSEF